MASARHRRKEKEIEARVGKKRAGGDPLRIQGCEESKQVLLGAFTSHGSEAYLPEGWGTHG